MTPIDTDAVTSRKRERAVEEKSEATVILFGVYIWWISRIWNFNSGRQALTVGVVWLLMTVAFEFGFGHWVAGHTWNELLHDYNFAAGRLWVLVPLWIATAPWVFFRLRQRARN